MPNQANFRADIQGLRAIAVLAVMLFHYNREFLPGGFIGVDVFFVISGYLITLILLKRKDALDFNLMLTLREFYLGRIKRIAPAYYTLLIVVCVISTILLIPKDFYFFSDSLNSTLWFASNRYFAGFGDYFAPSSDQLPLLHTWSLAIEMQFYLFYPFLIFLFKKKWLKSLFPFLIIVLFGISTYLLGKAQDQNVYYSLSARVPEFLIGGCIVLFVKELKAIKSSWFSVFGGCLIVFSFFLLSDKTPFPGIYAFPSVLGVALVLTNSNKILSKCLSSPILVWIGAISYSLYLWHWPILAFIRYVSDSYQLTFIQSLWYWFGSFLLAIISYYFVEQKFRGKHSKPIFIMVTGAVVGTILGVLVNLSSSINNNIVPPLPVEFTRYAAPEEICHGKIVGDCLRGDKKSEIKPILVLGDSHAAMLNHFFDVVGKELKLSFRIITASSCVPIPSFDYERLPKWAHEPCLKQIREIDKYIKESDQIIIASQWWRHIRSEKFIKAFNNFVMSNKDKEITLLADSPSFISYSLEKNHRFMSFGLSRKRPSETPEVFPSNTKVEELSLKFDHTKFINFTDINFFDDIPYYQGQLVYFDEHHLNEVGSKQYGMAALEHLRSFFFEEQHN